MSVDDNWGEALRKSANQVTIGDNAEYMFKVDVNGASTELDINGSGNRTLFTTTRPFSHLAFSYIIETMLTAVTWDNVRTSFSGNKEILEFLNGASVVKTIDITYDGLSYTIEEGADSFILLDDGFFLLQDNGDKIIL